MPEMKVDYDGADAGEIFIYASPETLRAIADAIEERGGTYVDGKAVDLDEPARIHFGREYEE